MDNSEFESFLQKALDQIGEQAAIPRRKKAKPSSGRLNSVVYGSAERRVGMMVAKLASSNRSANSLPFSSEFLPPCF